MSDTKITVGKVKTVFSTSEPDKVLIQYEDRVTAGNGKKELWTEGKGAVCCQISEILFKKLEECGIKTHYIDTVPERIMVCKKVDIIPIEVVVRNIAAGSIVRQTTIKERTEFKWPLVELYLKDDEKDDPLLTTQRVIEMGYDMDTIGEMEIIAMEVNNLLKDVFTSIGLTLVDFKLEFGYDTNKNLLLADELSPDGMRLWEDETNQSFDKDLFRKETGNIMNAYTYILDQLKK
tara:strand:- start:869 stop:1570 length:702 start_codon:yes stop_codon:yes gene_type:complete